MAVNSSIAAQHLKDKKALQPRQKTELERQTSITAKEVAAVRAVTGHSIQAPAPTSPMTTPSPRVETDFGVVRRQVSEPAQQTFDARAAWRRGVGKTELKPDLWKVAYNSIRNQITTPVSVGFHTCELVSFLLDRINIPGTANCC